MDKRRLRAIHRLLAAKLDELSCGKAVAQELRRRRRTTWGRNRHKSDAFFLETLARIIYSAHIRGGVVESRWDGLSNALAHFDVPKVARLSPAAQKRLLADDRMIRNRRKLAALVANAGEMVRIADRYGSFADYLGLFSRRETDVGVDDLTRRFHYLGHLLAYGFLAECGFDCMRPDLHLTRILYRLGFLDSPIPSPAVAHEIQAVGRTLSRAVDERLYVLDGMFWMYGGGGDGRITHAVCREVNPLCAECELKSVFRPEETSCEVRAAARVRRPRQLTLALRRPAARSRARKGGARGRRAESGGRTGRPRGRTSSARSRTGSAQGPAGNPRGGTGSARSSTGESPARS